MGLRAIFSGISGLQSHSTWLDVIGNNVSNVNTVAFKASRVMFSDQISQTAKNGVGPSVGSNLGGTNPQQVGLGTRVSSIQTIFTAGPTLTTGIATDIAIQGEGFLVSRSGAQTFFTRAGNLDFDAEGNLVDANGGLIQGFTASAQFTQRTIDAAQPLIVTDASLVLDTSNPANIAGIRIDPNLVLPPRATTRVEFAGNLDSFQPVQILDLAPGGAGTELLPFGDPLVALNPAKAAFVALPGPPATNQTLDQLDDFTVNSGTSANPNVGDGVVWGGMPLLTARANASYVWNQQPPLVAPAHTTTFTVFDSLGNPREITILFYQVNDIQNPPNPNGPNVAPPHQVAYAWYAFETTGGVAPFTGGPGAPPGNSNLLGGTGILEDYDRNTANAYVGDLIYFNTDGSPATGGAVELGIGTQTVVNARIYIPPLNPTTSTPAPPDSPIPQVGAEILAIDFDPGTFGVLGFARRDGMISDAQGQFQVVNGVTTYVPNHNAFMVDQDGYRDGNLLGISFNSRGVIQGSFSNGEIVDLAQIVMARVANPEGLNKVGNNYFTPSANSGSVFIGLPGQNGLGTVVGFAVEGSNVDLTVELSNMIIAQRGFEVNARTISVNNQTLDTLVNLGR